MITRSTKQNKTQTRFKFSRSNLENISIFILILSKIQISVYQIQTLDAAPTSCVVQFGQRTGNWATKWLTIEVQYGVVKERKLHNRTKHPHRPTTSQPLQTQYKQRLQCAVKSTNFDRGYYCTVSLNLGFIPGLTLVLFAIRSYLDEF